MVKRQSKSFIAPGGVDRSRGDARGGGWQEAITHPVVIILVSLLVFSLTLTILLWRDDYFNSWFVAKGAKIAPGSKRWMLGDKRRFHEAAPQEQGTKAVPKVAEPAEPASETNDAVLENSL